MMIRSIVVCCLLFIAGFWGHASAQEFELHDGDRVVFVGDGFIEHAQRFGYIEAALSTRWPDRKVTFRNIGWSGDTVRGEARDHYTNPPTAYEHLLEQMAESDPTVLIMGYGGHLAFENDSSLDAFRTDYTALLADVGVGDKQCLLLSPLPHEPSASPRPDVTALNAQLEKAAAVVAEVAEENQCAFLDLFASLKGYLGVTKEPLTTNGVHLTGFGYALVAEFFGNAPQLDQARHLVIDIDSKSAKGAEVLEIRQIPRGFVVTLNPVQIPPAGTRSMAIKGLSRGNYRVSTQTGILSTMSRSEWEEGTLAVFPEEKERAGLLRDAIIEKNALYFRKYRPQNETYLVGFRKYEQGQNAVELDLLDPLIHEIENEIGRLKVPQPITLTIERL